MSTTDLRTDFLRPGTGRELTTCAFPLRVGKRLVVTRMELHNETGDLIAVGTGTYVVP
ncbi:MAG: hotdog domain-containing protein [Acidimicrobiia bacterium]